MVSGVWEKVFYYRVELAEAEEMVLGNYKCSHGSSHINQDVPKVLSMMKTGSPKHLKSRRVFTTSSGILEQLGRNVIRL